MLFPFFFFIFTKKITAMTYKNTEWNLPDKWENKLQDLIGYKFPVTFDVATLVARVTCVLKSISTKEIVLTLDSDLGEIVIDGQIVRITLLPEQTIDKADAYTYEIDHLNADGQNIYSIFGKVKIISEINPS